MQTLFDTPVSAPRLARRSDCAESHEAAAKAVGASGVAVAKAREVFTNGGAFTDEDLAAQIEMTREVTRHARLYLERSGEIETCGRQRLESGSFGRLWRRVSASSSTGGSQT